MPRSEITAAPEAAAAKKPRTKRAPKIVLVDGPPADVTPEDVNPVDLDVMAGEASHTQAEPEEFCGTLSATVEDHATEPVTTAPIMSAEEIEDFLEEHKEEGDHMLDLLRAYMDKQPGKIKELKAAVLEKAQDVANEVKEAVMEAINCPRCGYCFGSQMSNLPHPGRCSDCIGK